MQYGSLVVGVVYCVLLLDEIIGTCLVLHSMVFLASQDTLKMMLVNTQCGVVWCTPVWKQRIFRFPHPIVLGLLTRETAFHFPAQSLRCPSPCWNVQNQQICHRHILRRAGLAICCFLIFPIEWLPGAGAAGFDQFSWDFVSKNSPEKSPSCDHQLLEERTF